MDLKTKGVAAYLFILLKGRSEYYYSDNGKGGIPYECSSFGAGSTFGDGSFYYDIDDNCVFYL